MVFFLLLLSATSLCSALFTATIDADISTFDVDAYKANLAAAMGMLASQLTCIVSAGSVVVETIIEADSPEQALGASLTLEAIADDPTAASAVLGVVVTGATVADETNAASFQVEAQEMIEERRTDPDWEPEEEDDEKKSSLQRLRKSRRN